VTKAFVDEHRDRFGVEPICKVLQFAPSAYRRHVARQRDASRVSARAQRDAQLMPHIERVWNANMQVYGADKVWMQMNREGNWVAAARTHAIVAAQFVVSKAQCFLLCEGIRRGR
jgi:hypothetical protein